MEAAQELATVGPERGDRGGIVWHTQGSGKSLSMVFLVRKMRMMRAMRGIVLVWARHRRD